MAVKHLKPEKSLFVLKVVSAPFLLSAPSYRTKENVQQNGHTVQYIPAKRTPIIC